MQTDLNSSNVSKTQFISLLTILEEAPDPRVTATLDHDLPDILTIALRTILCGGGSFYDMADFGEVVALDVMFGEDQSRTRTGYTAENLVQTRRLAINLLREDKTCKRGIKGRLLRTAINPDYLRSILKF